MWILFDILIRTLVVDVQWASSASLEGEVFDDGFVEGHDLEVGLRNSFTAEINCSN